MVKDRVDVLLKALAKSGLDATRLADESSPCVVSSYISTGCPVLDAIMGARLDSDGNIEEYGGLPCGRIVEIYGDTSTGKSLIAAQACATIQERDGLAVYIDTESAVSLPIMEAVGVDTESLVYLAPDTVEDVFKAMEAVIDSKQEGEPILIVWDSIAATSAKAEMDKDIGEHIALATHARIISGGLRKLTRTLSRQEIACLFLNQAKEKIGVMFGDKTATFGGAAVGFHSSIRIQLKLGSKIKEGSTKSARIIGINARANIVKNKMAPPFREAELPIYFGHGIDNDEAAFMFLKDAQIVSATGGPWYGWSKDAEGILGVQDGNKFQRKDWTQIMDDNWDAVSDLICIAACSGDLV